MKRTLLMSTLIIAFSLAGCAGGGDQEYDALVGQAEAEIAVASKMGYTWRDTEKFLEESKEAMKEGDREKAMKLAKKALKQAQLAQQQAKDQVKAAPVFPQ